MKAVTFLGYLKVMSSQNIDAYRKKLGVTSSHGFRSQDFNPGALSAKHQEDYRTKSGAANGEKLQSSGSRKLARDLRIAELHKEFLEKHKAEQMKQKEKQERLKEERDNEAKRREMERKAKLDLLAEKTRDIENRKLEEFYYRQKLMDDKKHKIKMVRLAKLS